MVANVAPERWNRPYRRYPSLDTIEEYKVLFVSSTNRPTGKVDWNSGAEATGFTDNWTIGAATSANGFSDTNNGFNSRDQGGNDGFGTGEAVAGGGGDNACRRCGVGKSCPNLTSSTLTIISEGHFARDVR